MRPRAAICALLCALAAGALCAPAGAGAAQGEPWWQLIAGSRPTDLRPAPDSGEVQEVSSAPADVKEIAKGILVAPISLGGTPVGCLATGEFVSFGELFFETPAAICEQQTGFPAAEAVQTPAELAELLEGLYGTEVILTGPEGQGPAPAGFGEGEFTLTTPGYWGPALGLGPQVRVANPVNPEQSFAFGSASSQVTSEGSGRLVATLTNLGNAPVDATAAPLRITDALPPHASPYSAQATAGGQGKSGPAPCTVALSGEVECSFKDTLAPYEAIEVEVLLALGPAAHDGEAGEVSVSGADAPPASAPQPIHVSGAEAPFGFEYFSMAAEERGEPPRPRPAATPSR